MAKVKLVALHSHSHQNLSLERPRSAATRLPPVRYADEMFNKKNLHPTRGPCRRRRVELHTNSPKVAYKVTTIISCASRVRSENFGA